MYKILLAIPTYNCAPQITRVLGSLTPTLLQKINEVIVIDNQSSDSTATKAVALVSKMEGNIKVLLNDRNFGLGGSHKVAFNYAKEISADYVIILHGDDQAKVSEITDFILTAETNPSFEAVLGSRFLSNSTLIGYSTNRIIGNKIINFCYSVVACRQSKDLGSGLNLFKVAALDESRYLCFANDITFNIDLLLYFFNQKANLKFLPITWSETDQISNAKNFVIAKKAFFKLLKWRLGKPYYEYHTADEYAFTSL